MTMIGNIAANIAIINEAAKGKGLKNAKRDNTADTDVVSFVFVVKKNRYYSENILFFSLIRAFLPVSARR